MELHVKDPTANRPTGNEALGGSTVPHKDRTPANDHAARTSTRATQIEIALEIDRLAKRCDETSLPFVAYLLRVARAALAEELGERPQRR